MVSVKLLGLAASLLVLSACSTVYEAPPSLPPSFSGIPLNGGRTQAVTVNPNDRDEVVIATQFGGLWRTTDGGTTWRHLDGLSEVFVHDVEYGADGSTLIATVGRTNHTDHHGGIWVSHDDGTTWTRPTSGRLPASARIPDRSVAQGVARDPDNARRYYVGTDYGVAISSDGGSTWTHVEVDSSTAVDADRLQQSVQSVLPFPGGSVLAMTRRGIFRSDAGGSAGTWRQVRTEALGFYESAGWNKMDRSPHWPYAFILKDYSTLYLYELGADRWTSLTLPPDASARGPFVRVGKASFSGGYTTLWIGQGTRALKATRKRIGALRALGPADWTIFGRGEGVHDDMGDLGLDGAFQPVMIGSDGGVFRPDPHNPGRWLSAAAAGSGMNSYLITDLAGINVERDGRVETSLHFSTQDNAVWGSTDSGDTWPNSDCCEGFHLEGQPEAAPDTRVTVGYGRTGAGFSDNRLSDPGLAGQRDLPDAIAGGGDFLTRDAMGDVTGTEAGQAFYLKPRYWIRIRFPPGANPQVVVSNDDGATWRRRFDLTVNPAGVFQRTKTNYPIAYVKAYLPVSTGASNPDGSMRVGLLRLFNLMRAEIDTFGAPSVINLPSNGSLGVRATEFDWQAVFGAHPKEWRFVIAPDIVNGDVKVTRDGGVNWTTDSTLTALVTDNGKLRMWDGGAYFMQVTHIAFDPYRDGRILVGTREAGILCSSDGGVTWGRIPKSRRILYATGFQFRPNGQTRVSTYGRGLWRLSAKRDACVGGRPPPEPTPFWARLDPSFRVGAGLSEIAGPEGPVEQIGADEEERAPISPDVGRPRLIANTEIIAMDGPVIGSKNRLEVTAISFGDGPLSVWIDGVQTKAEVTRQATGRTTFAILVPPALAYGGHRLVVRQGELSSTLVFRKVHLDEHLGREVGDASIPKSFEMTREQLDRYEAHFPDR